MKKRPFINAEGILAEKIKQYIIDNHMRAEDQLPSMRKMAELFSAGRNTINAAMDILSYQGIVYVKPRYGTFVANNKLLESYMDWDNIAKKGSYLPTNIKIWQSVSGMAEEHKSAIHMSIPNVSDNIYMELIKKANTYLMDSASINESLDMYHVQGVPELKEALCEHMARYAMKVEPEQIILTSSVFEAGNLIAGLILRKHATILYEDPSVTNQRSLLRAMGAYMQPIDTDNKGLVTNVLMQNIKKHRNCFLFTYPVYNYPLGQTIPEGRKATIQKICQNAEVPIIEFDTYRTLDFEKTAPPTYYTLGKNNGVIYVGSLSSVLPYAVPLTWVVLPHHLINAANDLHFQQSGPYHNTIYQQLLICEMFKNNLFYPYLNTVKQYIQQKSAITHALIHKYLGDICEIHNEHPLAYWVKLPISSRELVKFNDKVKIVSGICHSAKTDNYITISKVSPSGDKYETGLAIIREILLSLQ